MKPIVGLPVLFTGKHFLNPNDKNAATIARVNSDTSVNLHVINEQGNAYAVQNVRLIYKPEDAVQGEHYCQFHDWSDGDEFREVDEPKTEVTGEVAPVHVQPVTDPVEPSAPVSDDIEHSEA